MLATLSLPAPRDLSEEPRAASVRVRSADELRRALRLARDCAMTLDGSALDRVLGVDRRRGRAEVQAAARWSSLAGHPALAALGLEAFASAPWMAPTVGQSACLNCAGPDGVPIVRHVAALALVSPDGELRRADRDGSPDLFRLVVGGQGIFGVLYSVTLDLDSLAAAASGASRAAGIWLTDEAGPSCPEHEVELLVPPAAVARFLDGARGICAGRRLALHGVAVRRTLPEEETRLRWATREWAAVRIRFGLRRSLGAEVYAAETRRELLALALGCGGSFPVSDLRDATRAQIQARYPGLSAFLAEKRRADPGDRLQTAWLKRARATLELGAGPPRRAA